MPTSSNAFNGNLLPFQVNMGILGELTLTLNACFHVHIVSEFPISAFMIQPFVCHFPSTQFYPSLKILLEMFPYKIFSYKMFPYKINSECVCLTFTWITRSGGYYRCLYIEYSTLVSFALITAEFCLSQFLQPLSLAGLFSFPL